MSDYLRHMIARNFDQAELIQPRLLSMFEPPQAFPGVLNDLSFEAPTRESPPDNRENVETLPSRSFAPSQLPAIPSRPELSPITPPFQREPLAAPIYPATAPAPLIEASALRSFVQPVSAESPGKSELEPTVIHQVTERVITERLVPVEPSVVTVQSLDLLPLPTLHSEQKALPEKVLPSQLPTPVFAGNEPLAFPLARSGSTISVGTLHPITPSIQPVAPFATEVSEASRSAPVIQVTIGRIEVRATLPVTPPAPRSRSTQPPAMSLEDYLRQRGGKG